MTVIQVASFPFDDHNCPPIQLIISFCQSAYSWLKEDIENVVVVHCKAGMARTGLMISSLLLYLKVGLVLFFPVHLLRIIRYYGVLLSDLRHLSQWSSCSSFLQQRSLWITTIKRDA